MVQKQEDALSVETSSVQAELPLQDAVLAALLPAAVMPHDLVSAAHAQVRSSETEGRAV